MSDIKSLADQLRSRINQPENAKAQNKPEKTKGRKAGAANPESHAPPGIPLIVEDIRAYDNSDHKSMVHVRFDVQTTQTMNQFKMATGIDVTKLVSYSVRQLFKDHPELKTIIKQFLQNLD